MRGVHHPRGMTTADKIGGRVVSIKWTVKPCRGAGCNIMDIWGSWYVKVERVGGGLETCFKDR